LSSPLLALHFSLHDALPIYIDVPIHFHTLERSYIPVGFDPEKHHRRSIRLKGYDYSQPGGYFVTICLQGREPYLEMLQVRKIVEDRKSTRLNSSHLVISYAV